MINKIMNLTEEDPMYNEFMKEIDAASDEDLVIIARSYKNRKNDYIKPLDVKNGIYFYLAYDLDGKVAYLSKATPEQIYKAKANMIRRARLGAMLDIMISEGKTLEDFKFTGDPMNVATLDSKMYGGGLLYCEEFLKAIIEEIGDCYILPSSIHELIFVPVLFGSEEELTNMVREVNATQVYENEYLADKAFSIGEWI